MNGRSLTLSVSPVGELIRQLGSGSAEARLGAVETLHGMMDAGTLRLEAADAFTMRGYLMQAMEKDGRCVAKGQALLGFADRVLEEWLSSVPMIEM
ncbi:MAG TPA: hypothetical protein PKJ97_02465 [Candidatus Bilamarchaeaceae archaeon]|nr:hypothetical protein [Candidatus Bilamarchaeaceae archaeon]